MDHAASLPYVLAKTNFRGKVYMTHPTKAIYKWLMQDSIRVQNTHTSGAGGANDGGSMNMLFNEEDVMSTLGLIQPISFNTTHTHNGIRFTPYPAGHVLGACMYLIEIAGLHVLFTGDYSRENDRHLIPATLPKGVRVDCLITESTFGISTHVPRQERETALMKAITGILNRGGRALLPVFAIGRAQELLLILEDYWDRHDDFQKVPIYYASSLARKCMVVYQTYIDAMNDNIRSKLHNKLTAHQSSNSQYTGPWDFRFIRSLKSLDRFDDIGPCVMLASPGMLQNGVSRSLLERWAPDSKNGVIITGYSVEGTMAKEIMREPDAIPAVMTARTAAPTMGKRAGGADEKPMVPRRCTVQEYSFAAHVDGNENRAFIEEVNAPVVILVHGERNNMMRMRSRLLSLGKFKVYSPANCEEVKIPFRQEKIARVVGQLAERINPALLLSPPASDEDEPVDTKRMREQVMSGVLVQNDFKLSLMVPEDLREYTGLDTTNITCRQHITLTAAGIDLIKYMLESTFGTVTVAIQDKDEKIAAVEDADEEISQKPPTVLSVMGGAVMITYEQDGHMMLEWEGSMINDSIADAVMAVLLTVEQNPAAIKRSSQHTHNHANGTSAQDQQDAKLSRVLLYLEAQFGEEAVNPIALPKVAADAEGVDLEEAQAKELDRLHSAGIPVPGIEITVDKNVAKVWLERLEVESNNKTLADRVRAILDKVTDEPY